MSRHRNHQVRIIGGSHRGRKLIVRDLQGLRPTGDRIRETLFNWLQGRIQGSTCLDLFAGSGALGFEAASRGAQTVICVELAKQAYRQLVENQRNLELPAIQLIQRDAVEWLRHEGRLFNLVFLDPPFDKNCMQQVTELLSEHGWVGTGSCIYLEDERDRSFDGLPADWRIIKEKCAGQVRYALAEVV